VYDSRLRWPVPADLDERMRADARPCRHRTR
jgi:hypothetical protein